VDVVAAVKYYYDSKSAADQDRDILQNDITEISSSVGGVNEDVEVDDDEDIIMKMLMNRIV